MEAINLPTLASLNLPFPPLPSEPTLPTLSLMPLSEPSASGSKCARNRCRYPAVTGSKYCSMSFCTRRPKPIGNAATRRALGICRYCKEAAEPGRRFCAERQAHMREYRRRYCEQRKLDKIARIQEAVAGNGAPGATAAATAEEQTTTTTPLPQPRECYREHCKRAASPGAKSCSECREKSSAYRLRQRELGKCLCCARPAEPGRARCAEHRVLNCANSRRYSERKKLEKIARSSGANNNDVTNNATPTVATTTPCEQQNIVAAQAVDDAMVSTSDYDDGSPTATPDFANEETGNPELAAAMTLLGLSQSTNQ
ncbi:hypothetical protein F5X99DRAFT_428102 [Biscogniauxia marginata]|nr:hypothetical protein F5X99DRAFT_428102 [Biscogniauxia marginata]